jgi:hypothetical protein
VILAILTYFANWSKPKDIGTSIRVRLTTENYQCKAYKYHGESFFTRMLNPSKSLRDSHNVNESFRIANDFVRLDGSINPMAVAMAISTLIFGGLHCIAWIFEFPTKTELMIWMVASVASATVPTVTLVANIIVVHVIRKKVRKCARALSNEFQEFRRGGEPGKTQEYVQGGEDRLLTSTQKSYLVCVNVGYRLCLLTKCSRTAWQTSYAYLIRN